MYVIRMHQTLTYHSTQGAAKNTQDENCISQKWFNISIQNFLRLYKNCSIQIFRIYKTCTIDAHNSVHKLQNCTIKY